MTMSGNNKGYYIWENPIEEKDVGETSNNSEMGIREVEDVGDD